MILHLFGGSFDPPHLGHLAIAKYFSTRSDLVVISPLHASHDKVLIAPAEVRLQMCELAFQGLQRVQVSGSDIERGGNTFTIDTVCDLEDAYPGAEIHVVVGSDAALRIQEWKDFALLAQKVTFDVVTRHGFTPVTTPEMTMELHSITIPDVSSTEIREALRNPEFDASMLDTMTSREVKNFILQNRLYQV